MSGDGESLNGFYDSEVRLPRLNGLYGHHEGSIEIWHFKSHQYDVLYMYFGNRRKMRKKKKDIYTTRYFHKCKHSPGISTKEPLQTNHQRQLKGKILKPRNRATLSRQCEREKIQTKENTLKHVQIHQIAREIISSSPFSLVINVFPGLTHPYVRDQHNSMVSSAIQPR